MHLQLRTAGVAVEDVHKEHTQVHIGLCMVDGRQTKHRTLKCFVVCVAILLQPKPRSKEETCIFCLPLFTDI